MSSEREFQPFPSRVTPRVDTVVAVSSPPGSGAIGIVRLTGPDSLELGSAVIARPAKPFGGIEDNRRLVYGHVVDPRSGAVVDEVLAVAMRGPGTYTCEDMVEIHCHGGPAAQRTIVRLLVDMGARPAEPGEFTKRAFLNGRIDLAQAESVAAVIRARSSSSLRAAVHQLSGGLSRELSRLRGELSSVLAQVEAAINFVDEDLEEFDRKEAADDLSRAAKGLSALLDTAVYGRVLDQGLRTAIVGGPNVGKSSLLNSLVRRERAIVSEIPGTTRDTVEELVEIAGIPVVLVDTAGLRVSDNLVERLGVERSQEALETADVVLAVMDMADEWGEKDAVFLRSLDANRTIVVGNKTDLVNNECTYRFAAWVERAWPGVRRPACCVSALTGGGMEALKTAVEDLIVAGHAFSPEDPLLETERQRALVLEALNATLRAGEGLENDLPEELVAEDIREAGLAVGRITGEDFQESVLEEIFASFCIGK